MPSEMRRPGTISIDVYLAALDLQLRQETGRIERRTLPQALYRLTRTVRSVLQPILQSGAIVLTSLAVIAAVGAAPASLRTPPPPDIPVATPSEPMATTVDERDIRDRLPPEEFLAVADESASVPDADNPDMPPLEKE